MWKRQKDQAGVRDLYINMAVLLASSMLRAHAHLVGDGHNGGTLQMSDCSEDPDVRHLCHRLSS